MKATKTNKKQSIVSVLLFAIFSLAIAGFIPKTETGSIEGKVIAEDTKEPLPFVNVLLMDKEGATVTAATSDFDGKFRMPRISVGVYDLKVTFIGYKEYVIKDLHVSADKIEHLKTIALTTKGVSLDCIEVVSYSKSAHGGKGETTAAPSTITRSAKSVSSTKKRKYAEEISPSHIRKDYSIESEADVFYDDSPGEGMKREAVYDEKAPAKAIAGATAGTLTATELHDFSKWELWKDIADNQLVAWQQHWKIAPTKRYSIQLTTTDGWPVIDQEVELIDKNGNKVWATKTDNTGKAELWASMFDIADSTKINYKIITKHNGETHEVKSAKKFQDGMNYLVIDKSCAAPTTMDIMMVVDATGSMGDEINYLKSEMLDVVNRVKNKHEDLSINTGSVFYRDKTDDYITRISPFSNDVEETVNFIQNQTAGGGGDFPEAVDVALETALNEAEWSKEARARILFLVLDAPPHWDSATIAKMQKLTAQAAKEGIRIVPITGSGIDKKTEYLMRSLSLATNGTYVAITNHSGVGGHHIEPTTDSYEVEKLNNLMVRVITQYATAPDCEETDPMAKVDTTIVPKPEIDPTQQQDTTQQQTNTKPLDLFSFFPNPTGGMVNIVLKEKADELLITDLTGKLMRYKNNSQLETKMQIDLQGFSAGIYFIHVVKNGKAQSERLIVSP